MVDTSESGGAAGTSTGGPSREEIQRRIVDSLARVRAMPVDELWRQIVEGGYDCEIDSKEAEVVISILEYELGRELAKVEELEPEQLVTLEALTSLLWRALDGASSGAWPGRKG